MNRILASKWTKVALFVLCLAPLSVLLWKVYKLDLTANPLEYITHYTGDWTLRFLMITLAVTPLRMLLNRPAITRFRRMFGLFAFFYSLLHLAIWAVEREFRLDNMVDDVFKRTYITVGMAGLLAMIPLAVTSTAGWVRRMGFKRWQRLHRLVYFTALAGVLHFLWLVKSDIREPALYGAILAVLMAFRVVQWIKKARPAAARAGQPAASR